MPKSRQALNDETPNRERRLDVPLTWKCRARIFKLGGWRPPLIMGILNVTPDSFSDGGRFLDRGLAVERGMQMIEEGADIIDIGGESTRPGSEPVSEAEELLRVMPVVEKLAAAGAVISIDTRKAIVAREALEAGAGIVNDVSAMTADKRMAETAISFGAGAVLMHMAGEPGTMQDDPRYEDVVREVLVHLRDRIEELAQEGMDRASMAIDPGIGFGKTARHNMQLVGNIGTFKDCGRPVVLGVSRKRFLGALTGRDVQERLAAGIAAMCYAAIEGVDVVRVHDVKETRDALLVLQALEQEKRGRWMR